MFLFVLISENEQAVHIQSLHAHSRNLTIAKFTRAWGIVSDICAHLLGQTFLTLSSILFLFLTICSFEVN